MKHIPRNIDIPQTQFGLGSNFLYQKNLSSESYPILLTKSMEIKVFKERCFFFKILEIHGLSLVLVPLLIL